MMDEDRAELLSGAPWLYQDEFVAFIEAEPDEMQRFLPAYLRFSRGFVFWLFDQDRIDLEEAREFLDARKLLETEAAA